MIMAMMDDEEDEDEDFDDLYDDYDDIDLDDDVTEEAYSWREDADDGEFCGLDPEDFETEEEYEFELNWAETIQELLEEAGEQYSDGEFAFICEKCAPVFDHYGYFREAQTLKTRAEKIRKAYGKGT